jgi:hypothetical protein
VNAVSASAKLARRRVETVGTQSCHLFLYLLLQNHENMGSDPRVENGLSSYCAPLAAPRTSFFSPDDFGIECARDLPFPFTRT